MEQKRFLFESIVYEQLVEDFVVHFTPQFKFSNNQNTTTILIIERFSFFRANSDLTITLIFNRYNNNSVELHIVISGGKVGLLRFSYGAEKSALKKVTKFIKKYDPKEWGI